MKIYKIVENPFDNLSELRLIVVGLIAFLIGTFAAYFLGGSYPGIMSFKSNSATLLQLFYQNTLNTILLSLVLYVFGKILNPRARFLDLLITVLIARTAIYCMALLNTNAWLNPIADMIAKNVVNTQSGSMIDKSDLLMLFLGVIIILLLLIYFFYLLIKGFRISVNSKKGYHGLLIIIIVFVLEALASIFIPYYL
ncbi:hypothetical protein LZQ00_14230 [Sphingobacterium sp. SRCM116780]|uniref:hypothetical protein n=1 Tax=Sphingobacterium sp. SRCM116780 TaxID=2907623 RepID=UPI001F3F3AB6|nr:hypothetical protein [Sphingobacterium sp. SRCM116780]UIR55419.1 hypothetical protein LZQ00_14230 [Sphingobacterium sp. SRCM116780]